MHPIGRSSPNTNSDDGAPAADASSSGLAVRAVSQHGETPSSSTATPSRTLHSQAVSEGGLVSVASRLDPEKFQAVVECMSDLTAYYFKNASDEGRARIQGKYASTPLGRHAFSQTTLKKAIKYLALDFYTKGYKAKEICQGLMLSEPLLNFWFEGYQHGGIAFLDGTSIKTSALVAKPEIGLTEVCALENCQLTFEVEKIIYSALRKRPEIVHNQLIEVVKKDKAFIEKAEEIRRNRSARNETTDVQLNVNLMNYFIYNCGLPRPSEGAGSQPLSPDMVTRVVQVALSSSQAAASSSASSSPSTSGIKRRASRESEQASTSGKVAKKTLVFQPLLPSPMQDALSNLMASVGLVIAHGNQAFDFEPTNRCMNGLSIFKFEFATDDERHPFTEGALRANNEISSILRKKYFLMECDRRGMSAQDMCQLFDLSLEQINRLFDH